MGGEGGGGERMAALRVKVPDEESPAPTRMPTPAPRHTPAPTRSPASQQQPPPSQPAPGLRSISSSGSNRASSRGSARPASAQASMSSVKAPDTLSAPRSSTTFRVQRPDLVLLSAVFVGCAYAGVEPLPARRPCHACHSFPHPTSHHIHARLSFLTANGMHTHVIPVHVCSHPLYRG